MKNKKIAIIGLTGQSIFMEVDHFHNPGETIQAKRVNVEPGGKGYNQAIACARFGMMIDFMILSLKELVFILAISTNDNLGGVENY